MRLDMRGFGESWLWMMHFNWFVVAGTFLYFGASIWEGVNGRPWLAWTYLCYALANIGLLMIGRIPT